MDDLAARLDGLFARYPSAIGQGLRQALGAVLLGGALQPADAAPALLALAELTGDHAIRDVAIAWMAALMFDPGQITEAREAAAGVTARDVLAAWRAAAGRPAEEDAQAPPALGARCFEMAAFAVAVANGSAAGMAAHAAALREAGASADQLDALARLAAAVKGASCLP